MSKSKKPASLTARIVDLVTGSAMLLGLSALLTLLDGLLGFAPLATATLGGLAATVIAGRAGLIWDKRDPQGQTPIRAARGTLLGAAIAATVSFSALLICNLAGFATIKPGHPSMAVALSLVACIAGSVREEVLLRGIPMHFARKALVPRRATVIFASLLSPTAFFLASGTTWNAVVLAIACGFLSARLVDRTGSLWTAVAANAATAIVLGPITQGGLLDVTWWSGELSRGRSATGAPALVAAGLFVLAAIAVGRGPLKLDFVRAQPARQSPRSLHR